MSFVHLHTHSHYSLLDGLSGIDEMIGLAKKYGMPAIGLTDHGNLYGAIQFYKKCKEVGIKPIIGLEAYVANRTRHDKQPNVDNKRYHLTLLAKNYVGYKNLIKLVTKSHLEGYYYKPRVDKDILREHSQGLICLSGCLGSELSKALWKKDQMEAENIIREHLDIFGPENYYLEIMHHPYIERFDEIKNGIIALSQKMGVPLVATQDSHYIKREDKKAHETLLAVQTASDFGDSDRFSFDEEDFSFIGPEVAREYFKETPEAVDNTIKISDKCDMDMPFGGWVFPDLKLPKETNVDEELRKLAHAGLETRNISLTDEIEKRINYELKIIKDKGYAPYFLVVADLMNFARANNILTNVRGSVAGSLVTYLTRITNINPIEYELPFERFLNPERPSAPDIDMDFADNRRDEMLEYVKERYGEDKVAQIGTFGTMLAKGAVRDVTRALGKSYALGDRISKLIPIGSQGFPMTIERAFELTPELKEIYEKEAEVREIIDHSMRLEGCVRHISVHAAGVVIAPEPLIEFVPTQLDPKGGKIITQYDMYSVEEIGLLKFDFLGIRNLAILRDAVEIVKRTHGAAIDIENIPVDDSKTFKMLAKGETMGLFQLNGSGMTKYLKDLKPSTIHDINAMVALYRPGPIESIPEYVRRKHNPALIKYLDPRMKDILKNSYGLITYQDDVMLIAIHLAGYSWLEADKLRKAMGKKIPKEMSAQKEKLLKGFVSHGLSQEKADELWRLIEPFAAYGFNKCVSGDTLLTDTRTGKRLPVEEIYKRNERPALSVVNPHLKLESCIPASIQQNGIKTTYEIRTRSGKQIRATNNHRFLTIDGWKELKELQEHQSKIATPRTLNIKAKKKLADYKNAVLGYLLSEGNLCHPYGLYFYSTNEKEITDFIKNVRQFQNAMTTIDRSKTTASVYVGQENPSRGNILMRWIKELDLHKKRATNKFIPSEIFAQKNESLSILLGKMWQGDGTVSLKNDQIFYATSSERLAHDVEHVLLRLGVMSSIHKKKFRYRDTLRPGYTVVVSHQDNIQKFANSCGKHLIGEKRRLLEKLLEKRGLRTPTKYDLFAIGTKDTVPASILSQIRKEMVSISLDVSELATLAHVSPRLLAYDTKKIGFGRASLLRIGQALSAEGIMDYAMSDLYWDEVVSIRKAGREMTYDITLPPHHNFIANDIVVHNSHAASYGKVAYQTAYMKANFPSEYMTAVLTAESGDVDEIAIIISECQRMGLPVLPPDINESFGDFTLIKDEIEGDKIRFGLYSIKNLGNEIAGAIIQERQNKARYKSFSDFLDRVKHKNLNKKSLEALIKSGAMDNLGERGVLLQNVEDALNYNREGSQANVNQDSLFGSTPEEMYLPKLHLKDAPAASLMEKLSWEKELLGLYISGHPLDQYKEKFAKHDQTIEKIKGLKEGAPVVIAGLIEEMRLVNTKNGEPMAFVKIADFTARVEAVVFPRTFNQFKEFIKLENCIALRGKVSNRNNEISVIVEGIKSL